MILLLNNPSSKHAPVNVHKWVAIPSQFTIGSDAILVEANIFQWMGTFSFSIISKIFE